MLLTKSIWPYIVLIIISIMEAIHLMRQMMKYYRFTKKDVHMVFIDLIKGIQQGIKRSTLVRNDKDGYFEKVH